MAKSFLNKGSVELCVCRDLGRPCYAPHALYPIVSSIYCSPPVPMAFSFFFFLVAVNSVYFLSYSCILSVSIGVRTDSGYYIFSRRCAGIFYHRNCALPRSASPIYLTIDLFALLPSPQPGPSIMPAHHPSGLATNKPAISFLGSDVSPALHVGPCLDLVSPAWLFLAGFYFTRTRFWLKRVVPATD